MKKTTKTTTKPPADKPAPTPPTDNTTEPARDGDFPADVGRCDLDTLKE